MATPQSSSKRQGVRERELRWRLKSNCDHGQRHAAEAGHLSDPGQRHVDLADLGQRHAAEAIELPMAMLPEERAAQRQGRVSWPPSCLCPAAAPIWISWSRDLAMCRSESPT